MITAESWSDAHIRVTHDPSVDAAYIAFLPIGAGEAMENVAIERPDMGDIVLSQLFHCR